MKFPYWQNMLGQSLTMEEYADIKYPTTEVYTHVTFRTLQIGTFAGTVLLGPLYALLRKSSRSLAGLALNSARFGKGGAVIGLVAGPVMTYRRLSDQSDDAIYDRAYRLRRNKGQVAMDVGSVAGALTGSAAALGAGSSPVFGALLGLCIGSVGGVAYMVNRKQQESKSSVDKK